MKWKDREESDNVEDRRSMKKAGLVVGGGGSILIVLLALFFPQLRPLLNQFLNQQGNQVVEQDGKPLDPAQEERAHFSRVILKDTEDVWDAQFRKMGKTYRKPTLVLFSGAVSSACGQADSAVGPFYCPGDEKLYIDRDFFQELKTKYHAGGDFAQAYVIAHEIGHHVQKLLGYSNKVRTRKGAMSDSVRLELQADYLAGVWAYHAQESKKFLEPGDLETALNAANAIGDDALQKKARGYAVPDSFTHGTSAQRIRWFRRGFDTGDVSKRTLDRFFEVDEL
jgi:predicted metalloprotease